MEIHYVNQQTNIGTEFEKRLKTLPEDIQHALTAVASVDTIFAIGKKHGLMVDQIGKMADEIWKVMLGLANPKDFIRNLAGSLGIESMRASAIATDVNTQMFQPVRESLKRIYDTTAQGGSLPLSTKEEEVLSSKYQALSKDEEKIKEFKEHDTKSHIPPMIFPQNKFEEEFEKEPTEGLLPAEIAPVRLPSAPSSAVQAPSAIPPVPQPSLPSPLPPMVKPPTTTPAQPPSQPVPMPPASVPSADLMYPEKMKEVQRESALPAGGPTMGSYKSRDPYRESVE